MVLLPVLPAEQVSLTCCTSILRSLFAAFVVLTEGMTHVYLNCLSVSRTTCGASWRATWWAKARCSPAFVTPIVEGYVPGLFSKLRQAHMYVKGECVLALVPIVERHVSRILFSTLGASERHPLLLLSMCGSDAMSHE